MNQEELYDEWTEGESNGMRPKRVQSLRSDLQDVTGMKIPHRIPEIEGWLQRMRQSGVITRKLKPTETEGSDDGSE